MSVPPPPTHHHPSPLQTLAPHLLPLLPNSLPLLRRLQFHHTSPSARILATFPPHPSQTPPSFSATYVDRTRAPETECWIFSTYELRNAPHPTQREEQHDAPAAAAEARVQLLALLYAISQLPSPIPLMVIGSFHESLLPLLLGGSNLVPQKVLRRDVESARALNAPVTGGGEEDDSVLSGISIPYLKWLIPPPSSSSSAASAHSSNPQLSLPPGYTFSTILRSELALTISRTEIPKTEATLAELGSVGIRYNNNNNNNATQHAEGELIAWAFIGVDGSLTSLHVEPPHRGIGLAKAVAGKLLGELAQDERGMMGFEPVVGEGEGDAKGWAHSDVAVGNGESSGVARGLGGREGWRVRWVGVDLGRVAGLFRE